MLLSLLSFQPPIRQLFSGYHFRVFNNGMLMFFLNVVAIVHNY
jgi:hypothetical protein